MASVTSVCRPLVTGAASPSPTEAPNHSVPTTPASPKPSSKWSAKSNGSGMDRSCSYPSDSSTLVYDHEAFYKFQSRVETLCKSLWTPKKCMRQTLLDSRWPPKKPLHRVFLDSPTGRYLCNNAFVHTLIHSWLPSSPSFQIERLRGGGFNRIIGITTWETSKKTQQNFILRIPRFEGARPDREVAVLNYVQHRTDIPVATVLAKDFTSQNELGKPYVIQNRIPGKDLQLSWDNLSHEQRCTVARELARTLLSLHSLTNGTAGLIEADPESSSGDSSMVTAPFELEEGRGPIEEPDPDQVYQPNDTSTIGFFLRHLGRWRAVALRRAGGDIYSYRISIWDSLMDAVEDMDYLGLFKYDDICLCHLDLQARNIMAVVQSDQSLDITGYLDWDSAVFAPKFVACAPPHWLWADEEGDERALDDEDDEKGANDLPSTLENQELKSIFEEAVGPEFLYYAYEPQYPLARRLFRLARYGIWSNEHIREAERFLAEWKQLHCSLRAGSREKKGT